MAASKELLIHSPIGRIKWVQAPADYSEILVNLSRTFKVPQASLSLLDSFLKKITADSYNSWKNDTEILEVKLDLDYSAGLDEASGLMIPSIDELKRRASLKILEIGAGQSKLEIRTRGKKKQTKPAEDPRMKQGLEVLMNSCGFTDENLCREALIKANYDPSEAINHLFS